jgi:hypothetical protein
VALSSSSIIGVTVAIMQVLGIVVFDHMFVAHSHWISILLMMDYLRTHLLGAAVAVAIVPVAIMVVVVVRPIVVVGRP